MSALLDIESSAVVPAVLPGIARVTLPEYSPRVFSGVMGNPRSPLGSESLTILISDFNLAIDAIVVQLSQDQRTNEVSMRLRTASDVEGSITLGGRITENGTQVEIKKVSFRLSPVEDGAQADFVTSTLNAALTLSHRVHFQMPGMGLDLALGFELPLIETSRLLQSRQTSYWLMVIERATGIQFHLPSTAFSGADIAATILVFRAIVDRVFVYHFLDPLRIEIEANEAGRERLRSIEESEVQTFGPEQVSRTLLGFSIPLGPLTLKINDPYIEDLDRVRLEIARGDGHTVPVLIRSRTNQAVFELPEAPRMPLNPWDSRLQLLIDLERDLDARLIARYHALAASTLDGLSEEEKTRVTRRVELDDDAFLIDHVDQRDSDVL